MYLSYGLLAFFLLFSTATAVSTSQQNIRCRVCNKLQSQANTIPKEKLLSLPNLINFANRRTNICIAPCTKYSENITCSVCTYLLDAAEQWNGENEVIYFRFFYLQFYNTDFRFRKHY